MRAGPGPGTECPLRVGQDVEVLSHVDGYRGGFFRCKIHDMKYERDGRASLYIEYLDFPGEPYHWMQVYQAHPEHPEKGELLMVRPLPPKFVSRDELSQTSGSGIVAVVSDGQYKKAECVEWLSHYVWWKAKVASVREDGFVRVLQLKPPYGERRHGEQHFVSPSELRPALQWTEADGWSANPKRVEFVDLSEARLSGTSMGEIEEGEDSGDSGVTRKRTREAAVALTGSAELSPGPGEQRTKKIHRMGSLEWTPLLPSDISLQSELSSTGFGFGAADMGSDCASEVSHVHGSEAESAALLATSLYKDSVLPNFDRQSSRGMSVQVQQDGTAWQVICVNHCQQSDRDYCLGYFRVLEAATAARDAVLGLLRIDGLLVDDGTTVLSPDPTGQSGQTALVEQSHVHEPLQRQGSDGQVVINESDQPKVTKTSAAGTEDQPDRATENSKQVDGLLSKDSQPVRDCMVKESGQRLLKPTKVTNSKASANRSDPTEQSGQTVFMEQSLVHEPLQQQGSDGQVVINESDQLEVKESGQRLLKPTKVTNSKASANRSDPTEQSGQTVLMEQSLVHEPLQQQGSDGQVVINESDQLEVKESGQRLLKPTKVTNSKASANRSDPTEQSGQTVLMEQSLVHEPLQRQGSDGQVVINESDQLEVKESGQRLLKPTKVTNSKASANRSDPTEQSGQTVLMEQSLVHEPLQQQGSDGQVVINESDQLEVTKTLAAEAEDQPGKAPENSKQVDDLLSKDSQPVRDCMVKEGGQSPLELKVENTCFVDPPRATLQVSMPRRPAAQHTNWKPCAPVRAPGCLGNESGGQSAPEGAVGAALLRQNQSAVASQSQVPSALSPVLGGILAAPALPPHVGSRPVVPQPLQQVPVRNTNGQSLHGLVNYQVAGGTRCVGNTSVHSQRRCAPWTTSCIRCNKVMTGQESLGDRVDCTLCSRACHTECAFLANRLMFYRPVQDQEGPKVAGVYFTCGCSVLQLVLPRLLWSIHDGIEALSVALTGHRHARLPPPTFVQVTIQLQKEICLLAKILHKAPDPFLEKMRSLMEWAMAEYMQGIHLTAEFRSQLLAMIRKFD